MATLLFLGGWVAPWPAEYGSSLVPAVIFALAGVVALYHGLHPARRRDRFSLPVVRRDFPDRRGGLPAARGAGVAGAAVLVLRQDRRASCSLFMWVRGTLPRFRYDQLMGFTWKFLFPVAMLNLLVTGFLVAWLADVKWTSFFF